MLRGRSAVVACIVVLGLGSALAQGPSPGPSGSGSSSALSFGAPGQSICPHLSRQPWIILLTHVDVGWTTAFSCYGSVSLDANGKLVALDGGEAGNWPQTATINECPTRSPTFSGSGVSVGSSMSMGMEEDKCIMFVILPQISDFMTAGSASGSSSGSGGMDIPISVGGGCYDPTADWVRNSSTCDCQGSLSDSMLCRRNATGSPATRMALAGDWTAPSFTSAALETGVLHCQHRYCGHRCCDHSTLFCCFWPWWHLAPIDQQFLSSQLQRPKPSRGKL